MTTERSQASTATYPNTIQAFFLECQREFHNIAPQSVNGELSSTRATGTTNTNAHGGPSSSRRVVLLRRVGATVEDGSQGHERVQQQVGEDFVMQERCTLFHACCVTAT